MEISDFALPLSFVLYVFYLLTVTGEHYLKTLDGFALRRHIDGLKGSSAERLRKAVKTPSWLLRVIGLARHFTFIPAIILFIYQIGWFDRVSRGEWFLPAVSLIFFIYIAGNIVPALLSVISTRKFVEFILKFSSVSYLLFNPLAKPAHLLYMLFTGGRGGNYNGEAGDRSDEARAFIEDGMEKGIFESDEKKLLHSVVEFSDTTVKEVMTPRVDMIYAHKDTSIGEMIDLVSEHNHSRYPVYSENIDDVIGIINIRELLKFWNSKDKEATIKELLHEPYFVPESKMVDDLLREMQQKKIQMAIVVDEYGGTAGLVTVEDLIEEIVGEIQDEYEEEELEIIKNSDDSFEIAGKTDVDEIEELLNLSLQDEGYETVGGMVFSELGRVPQEGETIKIKDIEVTVLKVDGRKIEKVRVKKRK